ncbi:MAG TPA: AarF/UbiB family protein [Puia sp.]|nr:AarF/UbiB family protein [Puia sp.]
MTYVVKSTGEILKRRVLKGPVPFRQRLQRMGPIFIKIGQYLALRPDILPQEYCDELMLLFEQVNPFPWNEAKAILQEELGRPPSELFDYINPRPEAAGSLAQVHIARLKDGTEVAVKIQRPAIRERVLRDLRRASFIARLIELSGTVRTFSPQDVVREIKEWMLQEIDFTIELSNLTQMYQHMKGSKIEKVPRPYPEYSTSRVLTAGYLRGVSFSELLYTLRTGSEADLARLDKLGIDPRQLAAHLFQSCLTQIFTYQFFHADLHPGNLIAQENNKVGFVDFGLCDKLDETLRVKQLRYLTAVYNRNIENMFKAITEILIADDRTDMEAFRRDFFAETGTLFKRRPRGSRGARRREEEGRQRGTADGRETSGRDGRETSGGGGRETSGADRRDTTEGPERQDLKDVRGGFGQYLISIMQSARMNRLQVPADILSMYRALLTAETVARQLDPHVDLGAIGRQFFTRVQTEELHRSFRHDNLQANALNLITLLRDSPGQLQQLLYEVSEGKFALNVSVTEVPKAVRSQNKRVKVLVTAILSLGVTVLLARSSLPVILGIHLSWVLWGILVLFYISVYIQLKKL